MGQTTSARAFRHIRAAGTAGISPGDLQRKLGVSERTVSRVIGELVASGHVVRPTPKGPVYAAEYAPKVDKAASAKPRRSRSRRSGDTDLQRAWAWIREHKVIEGAFGLAGLFGIIRSDRVQQIIVRHLAAVARTGPDGANLVEKMYGYMYTMALGLTANAMSPEKLQAEHDKAHRKLAENYATAWNARLKELEGQRARLRSVIYEASDEEKAHYLVTMQVLVRIPAGQPGQPELGLRRVWYPGPAFPDEARRELAPPGSVITVEHFPRLLTIIAAELDERIRQHRVEPLPIQEALPEPEPPMTDAQRAKRVKQAQGAETKRQKAAAQVVADYQQQLAEEEPGEQGPGVDVIR